jgi:hypothetical protein
MRRAGLGEVHLIEGHSDRNSPSGAWVYPIPPTPAQETIDWETFLRDAPSHPFDPARFFRWRCFKDYGEGLAGDLYVHLLSGIQCVSGINAVPSRAYLDGQPDALQRWPRLSLTCWPRFTTIPA